MAIIFSPGHRITFKGLLGSGAPSHQILIQGKVVYYESIKRLLNRRSMYKYRCDERLKVKVVGSTRLTYTGLLGGLEHLKMETRLIDEMFTSVMGVSGMSGLTSNPTNRQIT